MRLRCTLYAAASVGLAISILHLALLVVDPMLCCNVMNCAAMHVLQCDELRCNVLQCDRCEMRRPPTHVRNTLLAKNSHPSKFLSKFLSYLYYSVYSDAWNCATMYVVPNPPAYHTLQFSQSESCHCHHPFSLWFTISCVRKGSKAPLFAAFHKFLCQQR